MSVTAAALWDRLPGQERAATALRSAAGSPGDAYLLTGPPGSGIEIAARVFAAAVLCPDQCGACSTCSRALRGIHPDVVILEPEGYTYPIEAIREATAQAALSPMEAARRVLVLLEADRIIERSQNALLKALEEPNPTVTWVLVAGLLDPLLPTILSRCRLVELAAVPEEAALAQVRERAGEASHTDPGVAVRACRGDAARAVALVTDALAAALRQLAIDAALGTASPLAGVRGALETAGRVQAAGLAARQAGEQAAAAELAELEEVLGGGPGKGRGSAAVRKRITERAKRAARRAETDVSIDFCGWLAQAYRDLAALSAGAPDSAVGAPDRLADLAAAASRRATAAWLRLAEDALGAQRAIRENALPSLAVEAALLAPAALGG
ncbi:MAG TPA: hypothetical protein VFW71_12655 [Actinomycetota bacterium]|nr:hypothetical protein [Actinomycetota bacterium]